MISFEERRKQCFQLFFNYQLNECIQECSNILNDHPSFPDIRFYQAYCLSFSDTQHSIKLFQQLILDHPNYFEAITQYLDILTGQPIYKYENHINQIKEYIDQYQGEKDVFYYTSSCLVERLKGKNQEYKQCLDTALEIFKDLSNYQNSVLFHQIGGYYLQQFEDAFNQQQKQEDRELSIKYFEKSLEFQPNHIYNMLNIACLIFYSFDMGDRAFNLTQRAYELAPEDDKIICFFCIQLTLRGKKQDSINLLKKKLEKKPTASTFYTYLDLIDQDFQIEKLNNQQDIAFLTNCMKECINEDYFAETNHLSLQIILRICYQFKIGYDSIREILIHFKEANIFSLFELVKQQEQLDYDSKEQFDILMLLISEMIQNVQNSLMMVVNKRYIQPQLSFQQNLSHLDLYF